MLENQNVELKREYNAKAKNTMLAFINTDGGNALSRHRQRRLGIRYRSIPGRTLH